MIKYLDYSSNQEIRKDIEPLFISAFPIEERPTPEIFFSSFKKEHNKLYGFYDDNLFVGFTSVILYKDICYIFFLAVSPNIRNKGYGSEILSKIKEIYKDRVILLCYEEVDKKYSDYNNRRKRERFYLKNGFKDNGLKTNEFGIIFQTVYFGEHKVSFEDYIEIFVFGFGEFARKHIFIYNKEPQK